MCFGKAAAKLPHPTPKELANCRCLCASLPLSLVRHRNSFYSITGGWLVRANWRDRRTKGIIGPCDKKWDGGYSQNWIVQPRWCGESAVVQTKQKTAWKRNLRAILSDWEEKFKNLVEASSNLGGVEKTQKRRVSPPPSALHLFPANLDVRKSPCTFSYWLKNFEIGRTVYYSYVGIHSAAQFSNAILK